MLPYQPFQNDLAAFVFLYLAFLKIVGTAIKIVFKTFLSLPK
jgi:hypothetical protein